MCWGQGRNLRSFGWMATLVSADRLKRQPSGRPMAPRRAATRCLLPVQTRIFRRTEREPDSIVAIESLRQPRQIPVD